MFGSSNTTGKRWNVSVKNLHIPWLKHRNVLVKISTFSGSIATGKHNDVSVKNNQIWCRWECHKGLPKIKTGFVGLRHLQWSSCHAIHCLPLFLQMIKSAHILGHFEYVDMLHMKQIYLWFAKIYNANIFLWWLGWLLTFGIPVHAFTKDI